MATKDDGAAISPAQEIAIAALIRGATVTEAASEAKVNRQTVSGWKNHDPAFIAALNRGRLEVWEQVGDRIRSLHVQALDVIAQELGGPNQKEVALHVMKMLARVNVTPTGATTVKEIENQQALQDLLIF